MPSPSAFTDAELKGTINSFPFAGVDSNLSEEERFARGVAQVVRSWLLTNPGKDGSHSVFLLQPTVPDSLKDKDQARYYALDDGETDVTSGLWFVGHPVIQGVRLDAAESFDDMFPHVVDAGLGGHAAVTFRHTSVGPVLRYYPNGLGDPDNRVRMTLADTAVELDQILALIDLVHSLTLVTPPGHQGGAKLWQNRAKRYPVRNVEVAIQAYLRLGLSVGLPLCRINQEQTLIAGRLDLEIEELTPDTSNVARHAILELKVLRTYGSTGISTSKPATEKWVSDGVDQAFTYRKERSAKRAALCCFDMRVNVGDDACLKRVETKAKKLDVVVLAWPLYPDVKYYRAAGVSAALSASSPPVQT